MEKLDDTSHLLARGRTTSNNRLSCGCYRTTPLSAIESITFGNLRRSVGQLLSMVSSASDARLTLLCLMQIYSGNDADRSNGVLYGLREGFYACYQS
ncbi:hypothetical protein EVAR_61025_1 [Eumeta japonica]|uniref:Uncharacterized protein n=1 Tax=Eumeta variegata TaxID=151549 RepID=A0A4C1ZPV8_EUMVA|nr:hypothetical protein EVAR_61025_1 [Eumeta japonica]